MMKHVEKEISLDYHFNFPAIIDTVKYGGKILEIAREEGNWIVLDNEHQQSFFDSLRTNSIMAAMQLTECPQEDAMWVLTQLIARHFEKRVRYQRTTPIMQLYLTNNCNMRCPHCYMFAGNPLKDEMKTQEIKDLLKSYRQSGGRDVKLTGGEIATRSDLLEIIDYAHEIGLRIDLLTNGTLWNKDDIIHVASIINTIQVSIDGFNEASNSKIRGKGNFEKALLTVDEFIKAGATVKVAITANYSPNIAEEVDAYANFAKSLERKYKGKRFSIQIATGLMPGRYGKLTKKQDIAYQAATLEMNNKFLGCYDIKDEEYIKRHRSGIVLTNCSYGYPTIAANGDVHLCPITEATSPVANIRTNSWEEIIKILHQGHFLSETKNLEPCNQCELKSICGGDCRLNFPALRGNNIMELNHPNRKCSNEIKYSFYELMIRTNKEIFH